MLLCTHGRSPQNAGRACAPLRLPGAGSDTGRGPALHCPWLAAPTPFMIVWAAMTARYATTDCPPERCVAFATRNSTDKGTANGVSAPANPKREARGLARCPSQPCSLQRHTLWCAVLAFALGELLRFALRPPDSSAAPCC